MAKDKPYGMQPTGTKRRTRARLIALKEVNCEHRCPLCLKKYTHQVEWGTHIFEWDWQKPCGYYFVWGKIPCLKCLEYPTWQRGKAKIMGVDY